MRKLKDIQDNIDATLDVLDTISEVEVSPFFRDKTLQRLFSEQEETVSNSFGWFSPRLQLATFICVFLINIFGIYQMNQTEYDTNISEFAKLHELSGNEQPSLFN
ncbi:hypothetical protein [Kordia sp.]|uniref:hypothetical protein n=1 Tax=Kordia sp. TaxID=1965332 RepID=UPI0025B9D9BF|nr:hypothetical protein [Kordia sp.]MCH2196614.1 hypothetical protein [Kordia sp.]